MKWVRSRSNNLREILYMDIRHKKKAMRPKLKHFTLKATVSAILAFNAKTVMATNNCPLFIEGTQLENQLCLFDVFSTVTVKDGGIAGGIIMAGQFPTPPSSITIDPGGTINNVSGTGIAISSSVLSDGLKNNGTISMGIDSVAVDISGSSTISGGIINSGTITTIENSNGINIIGSNTITGDISNTGTIHTGAHGLNIGNSVINGAILNNGSIISDNFGTGIIINSSILSGGLFNSGIISGSNVDSGITISINSTLGGDIINKGSIKAVGGDAIIIRVSSQVNGGISNSGLIESIDVDGIEIVNQALIQSNISNQGEILAGREGISLIQGSTIEGDIFNDGSISAAHNGINLADSFFTGNIYNTGTINGGENGIGILSTSVQRISNSGTIQGGINAISITGSPSVANIDIVGQRARIIGRVDAPDTTVNITNNTLFTSEGSYNVRFFNIFSNAIFNMANAINATTVTNFGTLAIADPLQTIVGDYTQLTGALFETEIGSATDYGQLAVIGAVDLSQSGDIYAKIKSNATLHNGEILSNIMTGDTLTPPTNGFSVTDNSFIWNFIPSLNNNNTGVNLTVTANPNAYNVCRDIYCQGAAAAIIGQVTSGNPFFSAYGVLPSAQAFRDAASQATPELINENIQVIQLITRSVLDMVPMWGTLQGQSSGDAMLYQPGKIWLKPYGASMNQNKRSTVEGFNASAYGVVMGKDFQWLPHDWLVGGGFAAGGDNMHGKLVLHSQSIHSNAYQGILYGTKRFPNHVYFSGQGLLGYEINHTLRVIPLYASTAKGSYNSWFTNIRAEAGWSTYKLSPNFVFTPEVDASYLFINQSSYKEYGSPMALMVASNNNSSLVIGAYGNGAYHFPTINQQDLTLTGYAGIAGNAFNSQPQVLSTFVASGTSFSTFGVQFNGPVFRGGAGVKLSSPTKPLIIELNYDLQVGNNAYSGAGAATIKYKV